MPFFFHQNGNARVSSSAYYNISYLKFVFKMLEYWDFHTNTGI